MNLGRDLTLAPFPRLSGCTRLCWLRVSFMSTPVNNATLLARPVPSKPVCYLLGRHTFQSVPPIFDQDYLHAIKKKNHVLTLVPAICLHSSSINISSFAPAWSLMRSYNTLPISRDSSTCSQRSALKIARCRRSF